MSQTQTLSVNRREPNGTRVVRRLRKQGSIPAVLYGHGEQVVPLVVAADDIGSLVRHGVRVVDLTGALSEKAIIREVQWDTFGNEILHLDLARISADERVRVDVNIELRGTAPGVKEGGIVEHVLHTIEIECLATAIPEKLFVRIGNLALNGVLNVSDVEVPEGVKVLSPADELVVHCIPPAAEEETDAAAATAEPELIGRKPDEEGEAEE